MNFQLPTHQLTQLPNSSRLLPRLNLHELPTEAAFDAEVAAGYVVVAGGRDAGDLAVLLVCRQIAADSALGVNCGGLALARLIHVPD